MTVADPIRATTVGHWKADRCQVYVGRGSIWGNPFVFPGMAARSQHKVTEAPDPIQAFERHLRATPHLLAALPSVQGKILGCYCKRLAQPMSLPGAERCHAEVIARYADRALLAAREAPEPAEPPPRHLVAPPHPIFDGEPMMTFEQWWRSR